MDGYLIASLVLIGCGVVLMAAEFFLPTGGILAVVGIGAIVVAVGIILLYGSTMEAVAAVIAASIGIPVGMNLVLYAYRKYSRRFELKSDTITATIADAPELAGLEALKGRHGKTLSAMRPSGSVDFDGRRVDALTEGMMLEPGEWVRCVDVRAGRVIVRRVESPGDLSDMALDELT